jgi:hypothetical protein
MTKLPRLLSEIRGWAHMSGQKIPLAPEKTEDRKFSCTKHESKNPKTETWTRAIAA